jgi:hypothetical protein
MQKASMVVAILPARQLFGRNQVNRVELFIVVGMPMKHISRFPDPSGKESENRLVQNAMDFSLRWHYPDQV